MEIGYCTLDDVDACTGTVVVIDVLRAFTTAAVGLAGGVACWELVGEVQQARDRRAAHPATILVGEEDLRTAPGFDAGNSPTQLARLDLDGASVVHRSTAGTQGVVRAVRAERILASSFAVAGATARAVAADDQVWFCVTGDHTDRDGDEDRALGEYVAALLEQSGPVDAQPYLDRVARSDAAALFELGNDDLPPADVPFCQVLDRHDFAMEVRRRDDRFLLERLDVP